MCIIREEETFFNNNCAATVAQCYPPSVWTEDKTAKLLFSVRNPNPKSKPNPNPNTNLYYNPNPDPKPNPSPKFLIL